MTPDFTRIEHAEVLRTRGLDDGILSGADFLTAAASLDTLGVELVPLSPEDLLRAAALSARHSLRIFDGLGGSLALDRGLPVLTGDARSARALAGVVEVEVLEGIQP